MCEYVDNGWLKHHVAKFTTLEFAASQQKTPSVVGLLQIRGLIFIALQPRKIQQKAKKNPQILHNIPLKIN